MGNGPRRVQVAPPPADPATGSPAHDFSCAYQVAVPPGDLRSSEEWGRELWEGAAAPLRRFMLAGWHFVLGLQPGPLHSPDHILGWQIVARRADETVCELRSGLVKARNVFQTAEGTLRWATFVDYERPAARLVWPPVSLLHRLLVRTSLRRAAARRR